MTKQILTVPFEHANVDVAVYNGWTTADAENDIAHLFNSWYPEFVLISVDWVLHTLKVEARDD